MVNAHLLQRLQGIQQGLMGLHASGSGMSAASKGREREGFVNQFLRACHPPVYRFGTGDITDSDNRRSGQADVVVEYPFGATRPRLPPRHQPRPDPFGFNEPRVAQAQATRR